MTVTTGKGSVSALSTSACVYGFDLRRKKGEPTEVVIECVWPSGQRSRMTVDEANWEAFLRGFLEATSQNGEAFFA